jgi:hypothetical protein
MVLSSSFMALGSWFLVYLTPFNELKKFKGVRAKAERAPP